MKLNEKTTSPGNLESLTPSEILRRNIVDMRFTVEALTMKMASAARKQDDGWFLIGAANAIKVMNESLAQCLQLERAYPELFGGVVYRKPADEPLPATPTSSGFPMLPTVRRRRINDG